MAGIDSEERVPDPGPAALVSHLDAELARLVPAYPAARLCIAFSGGVDSVSLLGVAAELSMIRRNLAVRAVHVQHGLQPAAEGWVARCEGSCARLGVPLSIVRLQLAPTGGSSPEAEARDARYAALADALQPGECLLTAHHQDDQLETVLLQLLRGAGPAGLAAMPRVATLGPGLHLRPLLDVSRAELVAYAGSRGLAWVEDPMNAEERYDRAYLRSRVLPALTARWPAAGATVGRSARHLAEAQRLLEALAAVDGGPLLEAGRLDVAGLLALPRERQANVVRWWLARAGLGTPSTTRLAAILDEVAAARPDAEPMVTWAAGEVRRYRGRLYAMRPLAPPPVGEWLLSPGEGLTLPDLGQLWLEPATGGGLAAARLQFPLTVRLRRGGESLQLAGNPLGKPLKQHFQEAGVEPWLRERLPLLYSDNELVAVADRWVAGAAAAASGEPGYRVRWRISLVYGAGFD